jgi:CheY-like chemotaxis protein
MNSKGAILLADDDPNDLLLMKMAHARSRLQNPLHVVTGGIKAIEYLKGEGDFADRVRSPYPILLLLDLKMPFKDGFDVLSWIRSTPGLSRLVVVVLTNSQEPCDIDRAFDLGANSYAVKPGRFEDLVDILNRLQSWWIAVSQIPGLPLPQNVAV